MDKETLDKVLDLSDKLNYVNTDLSIIDKLTNKLINNSISYDKAIDRLRAVILTESEDAKMIEKLNQFTLEYIYSIKVERTSQKINLEKEIEQL